MIQDIASAFGLSPDSLEPIEPLHQMNRAAICHSCEEWAEKCTVLEVKLSLALKELERFRGQC